MVERRPRLVRSKSSSSSLSHMNDAHSTGEMAGTVVQIDSSTWGNKGLQPTKFGQFCGFLCIVSLTSCCQ